MTDLKKLTVSLTKHGSHKIATILEMHPASEVFNHLKDSIPGVNIEKAQAQKNLSAYDGIIPAVWGKAKEKSSAHIRALTLIAIIFSHYQLIAAMKKSSSGDYKGKIIAGNHLSGKDYTNFACILDELNFTSQHTSKYVDYDLSEIFELDGINELAKEVLNLKLLKAKWDKSNTLTEELITIESHRVFSMNEIPFREWLDGEPGTSTEKNTLLTNQDLQFFEDKKPHKKTTPAFMAGHTRRDEGKIKVQQPKNPIEISQLHNKIQNNLYDHLCDTHSENYVGTEQSTGNGTKIDLILKTKSSTTYYEIKTAATANACIRQAISQLLEYAYWPDNEPADELIIVSQNPVTPDADAYLSHLRETFGLPLHYQQFDLESNTLIQG